MKRSENRVGPWLSTSHREQHTPGGGDELTAEDIGAAPADHTHLVPPGSGTPTDLAAVVAALQAEVAAVRAEFNAHKATKAGIAHK